jgi:hypothetical protein
MFEWIGYALLLVGAGALLAIAYVLARRVSARRRATPAFVPIAVIGIAIVLAAIVVPRYPRPTFVPAGINAGLDASGVTDPLYLAGSYAVSWTLEPAPDSSCQLEAALYRAADQKFIMQLVAATTAVSGETSGIESLAGDGYVIEARSECKWRVMLTPRIAPE